MTAAAPRRDGAGTHGDDLDDQDTVVFAVSRSDGYQPVNLADDTLELATSFILGPVATGGHQDRPANPVALDRTEAASGTQPAQAGPVSVPSAGLLRRGLRRLGWGVADQAVSSLSNAAISIYAARSLLPADYGAFSLAYVTYAFALNASRGLATDPLMVRFSGTDRPVWRRAVAGSSATALAVGLAAGICVLGASALMTGPARMAFMALGLTMPGLLLQDSWRYSFFALGRGSQAFLCDAVWVVAMLPGLAVIRATHHKSVFFFVLIWGLGACVAAASGPVQAWVVPRLSMVQGWVSRNRDLGPRYLAENSANSGSSQLRSYGVGVIAGLASVGYIQAANTLMGPFMVIFMGISLVTVPEAARVLRRAPRRLPLFCLLIGCALALAATAWGVVLLVLLPRGFGNWLLGPIWRPAYPVLLGTMVGVAGACFVAGASAGLRAMGASRRSLRAQIIASMAYVAAALVGAGLDGAVGAVRGSALAVWVGAALWWWQLHLALRERDSVPDGRGVWTIHSGGRHRVSPELLTEKPTVDG